MATSEPDNAAVIDPVHWDPLHNPSPPDRHWTTSNVGEAMPGVLTPLCWSIWGPAGERGLRQACFQVGLLTREEAEFPPNLAQRWVLAFYGRGAMQAEFLAMVGDRLPGTSGADAVRGIIGRVPDDMSFRPTRSRYAAIAVRWPVTFLRFPRRMRAMVSSQARWWSESVGRCPGLGLPEAVDLLVEADRRFTESETLQTVAVLGVVQPTFEALTKLVERAGTGDIGVLSGSGGAELGFVQDIWRASRNELTVEDVIARHGFHGPREGEMSSAVWREDPAPLQAMISQYAERPAKDDPRLLDQRHRQQRAAMVRAVLAALPRAERPGARLVLRLAQQRIPMRGVAKRSFLQALDVGRASARRAGELWAADGRLAEPDDVFFLTLQEITEFDRVEARELVRGRRARWERYQEVKLPQQWTGNPTPSTDPGGRSEEQLSVSGVGVSPGVVTGVARVVLDPHFVDVEPDEILVAPTTDPSWASIMFISSGLVVDIGGALSHAAVVARELAIPCVVHTRNGTRVIRTGDRIRIDGSRGTVEILHRAGQTGDETS